MTRCITIYRDVSVRSECRDLNRTDKESYRTYVQLRYGTFILSYLNRGTVRVSFPGSVSLSIPKQVKILNEQIDTVRNESTKISY